MMKKRVLRMILVMVLMISALFALWLIPAAAADQPTSGTIPGTGISWSYNEEIRHLDVTGSGAIPDYEDNNGKSTAPWGYWSPYSIFVGQGITEIGEYAFANDPYVSTLTLPSTLQRIGAHAFERIGYNDNNGFLHVKVPSHVTVIEESAFLEAGMVLLQLPEGLQTVGDGAFSGLSRLSTVTLPGSITQMGEDLFERSACLQTIIVSEGITRLERGFASYCSSLRTVQLPSSLHTICMEAFYESGIRKFTVPATVQTIEQNAFYNSSLEEIIFENGKLSIIPESCFRNCKELHSVTLPNGLKTIENGAFSYCENLSFIEFPDSLTTINSGAFRDCGLQTVVFPEHFETLEATGGFIFTGLKGAYFKGSGINTDQSENSRRNNKKLFGEVDEDFAIYTVPGESGWTGIDYEGCSDTTWYGYPLRSWDGKNINRVAGWNSVEDYYEIGTQRIFKIMVAGHTSYPLPVGFTITVGDRSYVTQSQNTTIDIPADNAEDILISKEGYHTYTLPASMLRKFNFITMWKDDGKETPVILDAYLRPTSSVFNWSQSINEGSFDTYAFYADVLWRDGSKTGNLYLKQGDRSYLLVENGYTKIQPGMIFTAEGKGIYLEAVSEKGSVTRVNTKLSIKKYPPKMEINLGDNSQSGNTGTGCDALEQVKLDFNLKTGMFPITAKMVGNKIIGTIGMDLNAADEDVEYYFVETKELVDKVKEGTLNECDMGDDIFNRAKNLFGGKTTDGKPLFPDNYAKCGIDTKVEVLGYFEGKYVQNTDGSYKIDWDQTKIAVKFTGGVSYEQQYIWMVGPAPVPVYWMVSLEAELETALKLYQRDGDTEAFQAPAMEFTAGVGLTAKAMGGIKNVFGLGVQSNADLEFSLPNLNSMQLENKEYFRYKGDTYAYGMLLDNEARIFTIYNDIYYFYYDGTWFPDQDEIQTNSLSLQNPAYQRIARPDPSIESVFYAGESSDILFSLLPGEGTLITSKSLKTNTYRNSQPQFAALSDGTQVVVWVEADGATETKLYYSVKASTKWSEPAPVDADHLSDDMPVLQVVENNLYLLWAESQEARTDDQDLTDLYAGLQVSCAKWNGSVFEDLGTVGQKDVMDRLPVLTEIRETPVLLWVSGSFDSCDLWGAVRNGSVWEKQLLKKDLRDVDGMDLMMTADGAELVLSQCPDGEALSASAKELFTATLQMEDGSLQMSALTQKTDNNLPDTNAGYVNSLLYWSQMDNLQDETGRVLCDRIGADAQILSRPGKDTAVVWTELQEDQTSRFLAMFPHSGADCEPVELAHSDGWVQSWSGTLDKDGKICLAINELTLTDTPFTFGQADLTMYTITPKALLHVSDLYFDPFTVVPGGQLRAWVTVTNEGSKAVSSTNLKTFFDGSTNSAGSISGPDLAPGESITLEFSCTMPEVGAQTLKVASSATADGPTCTFNMQDISVEQVSAMSDGITTTVTAFVINRGMTDTQSFPVHMERSVNATEENLGNNRTVLGESQTVPALKPQEVFLVTFTTDQLQDGDRIYVCADTAALDDSIGSNNEGFNVVQSLQTEPFEISASVTGQTTSETVVQVYGSGDGDCLAVAAAYADGKMLDAKTAVILSTSGTITTEELRLQGSGATEVRVFVLKNDNTFTPLKPVQKIPLTS